jgi:hypothetical protein
VREPAAALIEAAGPLSFFAAQLVYLTDPLVGPITSNGQWKAIARLLEDHEESRSFAAYLREGKC